MTGSAENSSVKHEAYPISLPRQCRVLSASALVVGHQRQCEAQPSTLVLQSLKSLPHDQLCAMMRRPHTGEWVDILKGLGLTAREHRNSVARFGLEVVCSNRVVLSATEPLFRPVLFKVNIPLTSILQISMMLALRKAIVASSLRPAWNWVGRTGS